MFDGAVSGVCRTVCCSRAGGGFVDRGGAQVASDRAREHHGPTVRRRRHSRPVEDAVRRRRRRRHLEDDEQRRHLAAGLRRQARHRRWACSPSRRRTRNIVWAGTGEPNSRNTDRAGRRRLQVDRRRHHLDVDGSREDAAHRTHRRSTRATPNIVYVAALGAAWKARRPSAVSTRRPTAARPGR